MNKLTTRPIKTPEDLVGHFDRLAPEYEDCHGPAQQLLCYRLSIIRRLLAAARAGTLLEIGCGTGIHLIPLAASFQRAWGTDISEEMVRIARRNAQSCRWRERIELRVDPAEKLATVADDSVDVVLCVGALEHMLDKSGVLSQVRRVLPVGGAFVCLTPNGDYCWYRFLAPLLGLDTRHLSTDHFLTCSELTALVRRAGMVPEQLEHWRFIPKGDLPVSWGYVLHGLDRLGRAAGAEFLRGGIALLARRTR
jgi:ubiquinone/menaquinone biosynthesis C-methylase UbiE